MNDTTATTRHRRRATVAVGAALAAGAVPAGAVLAAPAEGLSCGATLSTGVRLPGPTQSIQSAVANPDGACALITARQRRTGHVRVSMIFLRVLTGHFTASAIAQFDVVPLGGADVPLPPAGDLLVLFAEQLVPVGQPAGQRGMAKRTVNMSTGNPSAW